MLKMILALFVAFCASVSFAAGAVGYSCAGKNNSDGGAIMFDVMFSDSAPNQGYTNQSITIYSQSGVQFEQPIVLQMFGAKKSNVCTTNSEKETYMDGKTFKMVPSKKDELNSYRTTFQLKCGNNVNFDVEAYCFFQ
jgi:hypothetical protein